MLRYLQAPPPWVFTITRIVEAVLCVDENPADANCLVFVPDLATQEAPTPEKTRLVRCFLKLELERIAEQAGFGLIHFEEWMSAAPLGDSTWGACVALRAE